MLAGPVKRIFRSGPPGPAGATLAAALTDVTAALKAVIMAPDLPSARTALGLTIGSAVQAWSTTLDALGALTTTTFGRSLLTQVDAPTALTTLGAVPASAAALSLKANLLSSTASVTDATLTQFLDAALGNPARGSLIYRGLTAYSALGPASNTSQFLQSGGAGADPSWGTPAGAGNISAAGSPAAGQFAVFGSGTTIAGLAQPASRNRLRNGSFNVNQRGVSGTVTLAKNAYGHDGWMGGASGCSYTFAKSGIDTTITGGTGAGTIIQVIDADEVEGGAYVLSWTGTATARVYQGAASGSYAASPIAVTGMAAGTQIVVEFTIGGSLTLGRAQFEPGTIATAFERRKPKADADICGWYFQVLPWNEAIWCGDGSGYNLAFTFPRMKSTPILTLQSTATSGHAAGYPTATAAGATGGYVTYAAASWPSRVSANLTLLLSCEVTL